MAPSTFASAAAGSNTSSARADNTGDWSRRANGATQTFRRPSHATTHSSSTHQRDGSSGSQNINVGGVYVPPHVSANRNAGIESRYTKDQLLQLYTSEKESGALKDSLPSLYVAGWEPNISNGSTITSATWGRHDHGRDGQPGADICWEKDGNSLPLGLVDMTDEEKEHFSTSVNSPLKPPIQNTKEGGSKDGLRKTSLSQAQGSPGGFSLTSPSSTRPSNRRRDTNDAFPLSSVQSPAGGSRFSRDESNTATPSPALLRRRTDFKDNGLDDREKVREGPPDASTPFGSLKRMNTGPFSAGANGPSSPWSSNPQSGAFSPMSAFGSFAIGPNTGHSSTPTEKRPGFGSLRGESRFKGLMTKESIEDVSKGVKEKASVGSLGKEAESEQGRQTPSWMEARQHRPTSNDTDPFHHEESQGGAISLKGEDDSSPGSKRALPGFGTPTRQDSRDSGFGAFGMTTDNTGLRDIFHGRESYPHSTPHHAPGPSGSHEPMSPTDTNPYQSPDHERTNSEDIDTDGSDIHNTRLLGLGGYMAEPSGPSGLPPFSALGGLGRVPAPYEAAASDRSQTSSTGPSRGFPSLGGPGGLPGLGGPAAWPPSQPSVGTPNRERGAFGGPFGEGIFGSVAELQSPSLAGLGPANVFGGIGTGLGGGSSSIGRSSKMGSLFPAAMQEQMRASEQARQLADDGSVDSGDRHQIGPTAFSRNAFGSTVPGSASRETDSPFRSGRGIFDEGFGNLDNRTARTSEAGFNEPIGTPLGQSSAGPTQTATATATASQLVGQPRNLQQPAPGPTPSVGSSASNQAPPQREMVMPDRMRWIYRDPQGNTQGPWSGLEMHDWYKAGFFSPDLLIKRVEDPDFEPLAQMIRRIGNSREPFLVPQIGIPHGPPTTQPGNAWAGSTMTGPAGAQPPFAGSFPSFGTTLTAEQQNALERRKQEEQYLMARQKEYLAQQQMALKMQQMHTQPGMQPQQLHHHSSARSLHSQPSFGSITSPGGYQPSPTQGPVAPGTQAVPAFFDNSFRPNPVGLGPVGAGVDVLGNIREEEIPGMMERLNLSRGVQLPFPSAPGPFPGQQQLPAAHQQSVAAMLDQRAQLQREQAEHDAMQQLPQNEQQSVQATADRLKQFQELRAQADAEIAAATIPPPSEAGTGEPIAPTTESSQQQNAQQPKDELEADITSIQGNKAAPPAPAAEAPSPKQPEVLSLTEQVQKAAVAKQTSAAQSPWGKVDTTIPQPFPPPQSSSPLPAPAAQRRQNVADTLTAESRSRSETPTVETPSASIAPWAKEPSEAPKGPSLKEIQEAEAKKAAQAEEMAAAARRAALEKELLAQAAAQQQNTPGLPSTSTWASSASPVNPPSSTPSAWTKPLAGKAPGQATPAKKTLQQIQKEEEARKQRAAAAAAANAASAANAALGMTQVLSSGKRYADLASRNAVPQASNTNSGGGAWTTVGAGGKIKNPTLSIPTGPAGMRSVSAGVVPSVSKSKPATQLIRGASSIGQVAGKVDAMEEFRKWAVGELKGDLSKGINVDEFLSNLLSIPQDTDIITEAVHSVSHTLDSRHFAEEFIRRRKLADKGVVVERTASSSGSRAPATSNSSTGGWNEVAKKGGQTRQEELAGPGFKIVGKKKGSKR